MTTSTVSVDQAKLSEIMSIPALSHVLPYEFAAGSARVDHLSIDCAMCGQSLGPEKIKGQFTVSDENVNAAFFQGYGLCDKCRTITPLSARFFPDGTLIYFNGTSWVEERWGKGVAPWRFPGEWKQHIIPALIAISLFLAWLFTHPAPAHQGQVTPPAPAEIRRGET